ncbi:hypothetical protein M427DRAFT_159543, partial [Gonapodya prolifera JEL478]
MLEVLLCLNVPYTGKGSTPESPNFTNPTVDAIKKIFTVMLPKQGTDSGQFFNDDNPPSRRRFCARSILQLLRQSL